MRSITIGTESARAAHGGFDGAITYRTGAIKSDRALRQQAALAAFGSLAFCETNLHAILNEAAHACASDLGVSRAKVCQYRPMQNDLLIVAGFGWHEGIVNQVVSQANESSPQGRAYITGKPVICQNLAKDNGFVLPNFYAEHGIVSTIDVIVKGVEGPPFGILEVDSTKSRAYDEYDVNFLTGFANVLAEAVATVGRVQELQALIDEKDQLLADKAARSAEPAGGARGVDLLRGADGA